jgi:hypothetical protein
MNTLSGRWFQLTSFLMIEALPLVIALVVAWRIWPRVRARLARLGILADGDGAGGAGARDIAWRLALAGVLDSGIQYLISPAIGAVLAAGTALPAIARYQEWTTLVPLAFSVAWLAVWITLVAATWTRVRWRHLMDRFGAHDPLTRPLAIIAVVPWWMWPLTIVTAPFTVWTKFTIARMAVGSDEIMSLTLNGTTTFGAGYGSVVMAVVDGLLSVVAFGYALLVARGIMAWFGSGHRSYIGIRRRIADAWALVTLTGLLGSGLWYFLLVTSSVVSAVIGVFRGSPGVEADILGIPACVSAAGGLDSGVAPLIALAWTALPFVALPVAHRLFAAIRYKGLERYLGWYPSGREARLLWLALAGCLVWPYQVAENACALHPDRNVSPSVLVAIVAVVLVLAGSVVARPPHDPSDQMTPS